MGELVGRIAQAEYEAKQRVASGDHRAADAWREQVRKLENKRLTWERGEPWTGGGD